MILSGDRALTSIFPSYFPFSTLKMDIVNLFWQVGDTISYIIGVRAEGRRPLWNEIRFCERATATSRAF
jgi:hypothetical protein